MDFNEFFEGAEKRIFIETNNKLDIVNNDEWVNLLEKTSCHVLSIIQNEYYVFFLLSESSFLVGKNTLMLKTCGNTNPLIILDHINSYNSFIYSHPHFLKPELQEEPYDSIEKELCYLDLIISSDIVAKPHHTKNIGKWFYYQYGEIEKSHKFYEFVCWNFKWLSHHLLLDLLKTHFETGLFDDKCFEPIGYSLNMLDKSTYLTIHITPQKSCCYMSVETNYDHYDSLFSDIAKLIDPENYEMHKI